MGHHFNECNTLFLESGVLGRGVKDGPPRDLITHYPLGQLVEENGGAKRVNRRKPSPPNGLGLWNVVVTWILFLCFHYLIRFVYIVVEIRYKYKVIWAGCFIFDIVDDSAYL